jgi:hypothetical protein
MMIPLEPNTAVIPTDKLRYKLIPDLSLHDVIYSVAAGVDGKIYLGISSEFGGAVQAHFGSYDPKTDQYRDIIHLEDLIPEGKDRRRPPHAKIHTAMMAHPDGRIIWVTHTTPPIEGEKGHRIYEIYADPERGYLGSYVFSYDPVSDIVQNLGRLYPFNGTRFATLNPELDEVYAVSYPTAHFTVFRLGTGESKDLGRISQLDALGPCWSANGCAYTTDDDGYLIRYDPKNETLERLPVRIPAPQGHLGNRNRVRRLKTGPDGVKLYGLTGLSCHLFEYDPTVGRHGSMRDIGLLMGKEHFEVPNLIPQAKALTFGKDGRLFVALNVGGGDIPGVHVMELDPQTGEAVDHGRMGIEGMLPFHTVQDACTDDDGNIYFGVAVSKPPTFLAAFNPQGLPAHIVREQEKELIPYRLEPSEFDAVLKEVHARFDDYRQYAYTREMAFVTKGSLRMYDLGLEGYDPLIPPGESAITALTMGRGAKLYGVTSGKRCHLFVFWTAARSLRMVEYPLDLGILTFGGLEQTNCDALVTAADGMIYGGTWNQDGSPGHLFRHDPAKEIPGIVQEFTFHTPIFDRSPGTQIEDLGIPVKGEGIRALVSDLSAERLYGLGTKGTLFSYDLITGTVVELAHLEGPSLSKALLCDGDGNVFGSMGEGKLFKYLVADQRLNLLPGSIPCNQGRAHINALSAAVWGIDGKAYCGTTADGYLFSLEVREPGTQVKIRSLGKPTWSGYIRALTTGNDGVIYGIAGREDVFSRLFSYHPEDNELIDLGILQATVPRQWVGQRFDAMATGENGEIFLGEADRISHLFTFYPPVKQVEGVTRRVDT